MAHALRPLTLGELLDRTFSLYRHHFVLFVGIAALPNILSLVYQLWVTLAPPDARGVWLTIVSALAGTFVYFVTTALSQGATVIAVSQIQLGLETNIREAFGDIRSRLGELIILMLNVGVRVFLGFLLLIVPGILLMLRYALAVPVAVLETTTISESLSRSAELTRGHRGRILIIYVLLFVLVMAVMLMWQLPAGIVMTLLFGARPADFPAWAQAVLLFGNFVAQSIVAPITTIAIALVYYDERVRKEAFDLDHMMQQLDAVIEPSPAT